MFAPALLTMRHIPIGIGFLLSGPVLAAWITPSMNEQASIWCFFSVFQCLAYTAIAFLACDAEPPVLKKAKHSGAWGEKPMEYHLVESSSSKMASTNGHANGKKHR
jgi:hypothetical protein